ncbi:hypothetical protein AAG906_018809 [Vitis piasezkii]
MRLFNGVIEAECLALEEDSDMVACLDVMNLHIEGDSFVIVSEPSLKAKVLSGLLIRWAGERAQRERLRDLAVFERLHGNPGKTSPSLAVKKFCRTIATKHMQASDVRPLPVLEETLNYLLNLLDATEHPFEVYYY